MHGPPQFITQDWVQSKASVQRLAALEPELVVTGHGHAMRGTEMRAALRTLAREFDDVAVPKHGQYVSHPAKPEAGSAYIPVERR
jgi:glyoxylase-like metal-dependent hydrolase (beta-lactamase superfamily II)